MKTRYPRLYAAVKTAAVAFVVLFAGTLSNFLGEVYQWAGADMSPFPDMRILAKGLVSAVASAGIGLLNAVVNWLAPSTAPTYMKEG